MSGKDDERRLSPGCLAKILGPLIWAVPGLRGNYQSLPEQTVGANNLFAGLEAAAVAWIASLRSTLDKDRGLLASGRKEPLQPIARLSPDDAGDTDVRNYQ